MRVSHVIIWYTINNHIILSLVFITYLLCYCYIIYYYYIIMICVYLFRFCASSLSSHYMYYVLIYMYCIELRAVVIYKRTNNAVSYYYLWHIILALKFLPAQKMMMLFWYNIIFWSSWHFLFFFFYMTLAVDDIMCQELLNWFFAQGYQYFRPINGHDGSTLSVPSSTYVSHYNEWESRWVLH